jgi:hypothetical protein
MGRSHSQEFRERSFPLFMIRDVSSGIIIPPAGASVPYRRPRPPSVVPGVEVLFQGTGLGRDKGENAYFYDRQGHGYDPKLKGLFMDTYF